MCSAQYVPGAGPLVYLGRHKQGQSLCSLLFLISSLSYSVMVHPTNQGRPLSRIMYNGVDYTI